VIGGRHVIEHQENARERLHDENEQQHGAKHVGPTGAAWNRLVEHLRLHLPETDALIDKREDFLDDRGLRAGWIHCWLPSLRGFGQDSSS
jgi:hypothetical protein